jgi:tetratricopeptide (TPR) repeat protein
MTNEPQRPAPVTVQDAVVMAFDHHRAGRLDQAALLCRSILAVVPDHPNALHLLGMGEIQAGDFAGGLRRLARALDRVPNIEVLRIDLARALDVTVARAADRFRAGELGEAGALCRTVIELAPAHAAAFHVLGIVERRSGDEASDLPAVAGLRLVARACRLDPAAGGAADDRNRLAVDATNRALDHYNGERPELALALFARILPEVPDHEAVHRAFATVLRRLGRHGAAIPALRRVLFFEPADADTLFALGDALSEEEHWAAAALVFRRLCMVVPDHESADFRRRIACGARARPSVGELAAGGVAGEAEAADPFAIQNVLALRHDHYRNWRPSADLIRHPVPVAPPASPVAWQDYDAYYRGERLPQRRRIHPDDPSAAVLLEKRAADLFYVPYFSGTAFGWLTTVARHGDTASNGGTPFEMLNRLFRKIIVHAPSNRILIDLDGCRRYEHDNDAPVVFIDNYMNYGHWLLDHLPTLQFTEGGGIADHCTLFCPAVNRWQAASLYALGFGDRVITTDWEAPRREHVQHHRFRHLWFCGAPPIHARVRYLREKLLPAAQGRFDAPRIFVTRRGRPSTRMKNEPEVIRFLEERGFLILAPEEFSFFEQIALFAQARVVVSATGSAYANIVFCPRDAAYIELTSRSMFDVVKESFDHYDMFSTLGVRHIPLLHDSRGLPGMFPEETGFTVDFDQLDKVLRSL